MPKPKKHCKTMQKAADLKTKPTEKMGMCEECAEQFPASELYYGPDSYQEKVYDDDTPTVLCKDCLVESRTGI